MYQKLCYAKDNDREGVLSHMDSKLNWIGFLCLYVGLFLMTQIFSEEMRIEALASWTVVFIGFLIYFVGVIAGVFGFLRSKTPLRWINLVAIFLGIFVVSVFMFLPVK